jgi:hypothetical protein
MNNLPIYIFSILVILSPNAMSYDYIVEGLRGEVTLQGSGKNVFIKEELQSNSILVTGEKSFVRVRDSNGGVLAIGSKSSVKLNKLKKDSISSVELLRGQLRATFEKNEKKQFKLLVKTKTAALGIRGTDFHFIYNPDNNISSVLTYEGKVEFVESNLSTELSPEEFEKIDKIKIPRGYMSGVFYNDAKAIMPVKISPLQFSKLESNTDLIQGSAQNIARAKESKLSLVNSEGAALPDLSTGDKNLVPVPRKFIDEEYFEDKVAGNPTIKSGGYLDLNTGIYIHPAENSDYDEVNDIYFPAVEFGGIDEESGEYVAPPGLILHPLKGFMYTTDLLQKGFHQVTTGVSNVVTPVTNTLSNAGEKTLDLIKGSAESIRDNTGVVGETVGKGVELLGDGVSGSINIAEDSSSYLLNNLAKSLNYVVHDTFLTKVKEIKEKVPLINYFKIKLVQSFNYNHINSDKYNFYDRNVVRHDSINSQTVLDFRVQKSFYTKFFVRPRFEFKNINYLSDYPTLKSFDYTTYYTGSDFGYISNIKEMKSQTFFSIEKGKKRKAEEYKNHFLTTEDSWRFGFNKIILGQKMFSTTFSYLFENYTSPFDGKGKRHSLKLSEILSVNKDQFLRVSLDWNKVKQEQFGNTSNWSTRINFYQNALKWNMNFDYWVGFRLLNDTGTIIKRETEKNYFIGTSLNKEFQNNFNVGFNYEMLKQKSPMEEFDYLSQNIGVNLGFVF